MLLNEQKINEYLQKARFTEPLTWHILSSIDSTNRYLKDLPSQPIVTICCAETQTHGRGRLQRSWFSPAAENIYCSIRWPFPNDLKALAPFSLVTTLAIVDTLAFFNLHEDLTIKWPNDLFWQDKKLCGILLETVTQNPDHLDLIIGIGLNVNTDSTSQPITPDTPSKPWCSLYDITHHAWDRNPVIARLIINLYQCVSKFVAQGFEPFMQQWSSLDYLYGKTVTITQGQQIIRGIAQGINLQGELLLMDGNGQQCTIAGGEASVAF